MTDHEGQIPLGDDYFIDMGGMTVGHYALSEKSQISDRCLRECDPDEIVESCGSQAVAELCMRNALQGGGPQEMVTEVEIQCNGPKRRLLGGQKCGAKTIIHEVVMPLDLESKETVPPEVPEIMPGVTFVSLVGECITEPDRTQEYEGLHWGDKVINLPGVSSSTHIAVGNRDGIAIEIDINQSSNPFSPARIYCDVSGASGRLKLKHNDVADQGGYEEFFAVEDRAKLDARVTELFKKYFVNN